MKKEKKQMKKIKIGMILLSIMLLITASCYAAEASWKINFETESTNITKTQELVKIDIILKDYQGDGILGYEGELIYDENIFETATITALSDWDNVSYDKETRKFLSTTTIAKKDTKIAQITLKLKSNITEEKTEVVIKNLALSDGEKEITTEKAITYHFPYNEEEETTSDKIPDTDEKTEPEKKPNVPEIDTTTDQKQDSQKQPNTESTNKGVAEDKTKAQTRIPQTGATPIEIVSIVVITTLAIFGYGKYRSIHLK